jgi:thiosulfate/3-mercaptopyruvate sulfurtransferase
MIVGVGSGVTASVVFFAARMLGSRRVSLYDGSWSEYASNPNSKIAT